jgi:hypothetical protein
MTVISSFDAGISYRFCADETISENATTVEKGGSRVEIEGLQLLSIDEQCSALFREFGQDAGSSCAGSEIDSVVLVRRRKLAQHEEDKAGFSVRDIMNSSKKPERSLREKENTERHLKKQPTPSGTNELRNSPFSIVESCCTNDVSTKASFFYYKLLQ